jgi:transcriptional regulator with XRE-family HTH domain
MQKPSENSRKQQAAKAPIVAMTDERKREIVAQFTDDVLSKLVGAFFDVCKIERWTKRDLSQIAGMNETAIGHIFSGRRKNLTVETIALLSRAMHVRPELVMHDTRSLGNHAPTVSTAIERLLTPRVSNNAARSLAQYFESPNSSFQTPDSLQSISGLAERAAYAVPEANGANAS